MQIESLENILFPTVNPLLRSVVKKFDVECEQDGSLLVNSLKYFLGENVELCKSCSGLNRMVVNPFFEVGSRILRVDKEFMRRVFFEQKYGEAWMRGFALMMKGIEKYGICIPFIPAAPFEIVWNITYSCNLKCKHCYENAGFHRPELTTEQVYTVIDILSEIAGFGLPALSFSGGEPLLRKDFF